MSRQITGTIYKFDGLTPWAGARLVFSLLTDTATGSDAAWPVWSKTVQAGSDGTIPDGTLLDTPPTGSWLYRLRIEENTPLDFYLSQGDGSAVSVSDIVTLAGGTGSSAGTPQQEWLLDIYDGLDDADAGQVLTAVGDGTAEWDDAAVTAEQAAWLTEALATVPDAGGLVDDDDLGTAAYEDVSAFDAAGSAALRVAKVGDIVTGQLKIQKNYTFGDLDSVPLRIIGSGQAADVSGWPLLELYNPDPDNVGQYAGETKIFIRAGNGQNRRRYIHYRKHDNSGDDWITGVNASDVHLIYDAQAATHRLWMLPGGDTYFNAAPGATVRINFAGTDEVGDSFRVYRGGAAAGNNYLFYIENGTPGSMDSSTLLAMNSGTASGPQSAYFRLQDNGTTKFYFGKSSSNGFLIRDEINARNSLFISPTNGRIGINDSGPAGMLHVTSPDTATRGLVVDVPTGNTARILECTKNDVIQFAVENGGRLRTNQSAAGTTPGSVVAKMPVYDIAGTLIGQVAIYDAIT